MNETELSIAHVADKLDEVLELMERGQHSAAYDLIWEMRTAVDATFDAADRSDDLICETRDHWRRRFRGNARVNIEAIIEAEPILRRFIQTEITNGNDGRGGAFWSSAKRRKEYETYLRFRRLEREPFDHPVRLVITRILGKGQRLWDADSVLRGSAKGLIDALVVLGWFVDDGPKYITTCDGRQDDTQRQNGPAVLIEVFKTGVSERR